MKINAISKYSINKTNVSFKKFNGSNFAYFNPQMSVNIPKPINKTKTSYKNILIGVASLLGIVAIGLAIKKHLSDKAISPYTKTLAKSLSEYLGKEIKPQQLKSVISGKEVLKILKGLKKENFVASKENIQKGIFLADLHSHSLHSDGAGEVQTILHQVAEYADGLYQKTGKKFLFALTDHDTADGVKTALELIAQNPKKYRNINFVTGSEISFVIKSDKSTNPYETIEVLAYGINPFERKTSEFFTNIRKKREKLATEFIEKMKKLFGYADFSQEEFEKTFSLERKNFIFNNQWKVHHYGQTKNAIAGLANSQCKDKNLLYQEIMSKTDKRHMALGNLRDKGLIPQSYGDDTRITQLCKEVYSPHIEANGKLNPAGENTFESIIETFSGNDDMFLALAHPYYITERTSKPTQLINELISKSKGLLKGTEEYHQAYNNVDMSSVVRINNEISSMNTLVPLGGRDNHETTWLNY